MPYPFVLAANGESIARVNPDVSWSVRWDRVLDVAYDHHPRRIAVRAVANLLLTARDNFLVTPWELSTTWENDWQWSETKIDYLDQDPLPGQYQSTIIYNGDIIALINHDGSWTIDWDDVAELARHPINDVRAITLVAICRLFMAAKDRFWTTPWQEEEEE